MPARRHALSDTHFSTREVSAETGLSRETIAALVQAGSFPPPITVNPHAGRTATKLYLKEEVRQWIGRHN